LFKLSCPGKKHLKNKKDLRHGSSIKVQGPKLKPQDRRRGRGRGGGGVGGGEERKKRKGKRKKEKISSLHYFFLACSLTW
jgi:hypothetical protein